MIRLFTNYYLLLDHKRHPKIENKTVTLWKNSGDLSVFGIILVARGHSQIRVTVYLLPLYTNFIGYAFLAPSTQGFYEISENFFFFVQKFFVFLFNTISDDTELSSLLLTIPFFLSKIFLSLSECQVNLAAPRSFSVNCRSMPVLLHLNQQRMQVTSLCIKFVCPL